MLNSPDIQPQNPQEILQKYSRAPDEKDLKWIKPDTRVIEAKYQLIKDKTSKHKQEIKYPFDYKDVPQIPNGLTKDDIIYETPCFLDGVKFHVTGDGADFYQGVMTGRIAIVKKLGQSIAIWDQQGEVRMIPGDKMLKDVAIEIQINNHLKAVGLLENDLPKANKHQHLMEEIFINYQPIATAIDSFSSGEESLDQIALNVKNIFTIKS